MSYNSAAVASQLVAILSGLPGMGTAQIGVPESVGLRVSAYVTLGSQTTGAKTAGIKQRETRFFVVLAYRLDGAESTAETTLMGLVDAFFQAIHDDKTLGGTVFSADVDSQAADDPDYQLRAGKEYREYPVIVTVTQQAGYAVNP